MTKRSNVFSSDWPAVLFLFLVAAILRMIPEIKAGIWPIGYDTFNTYAAELASYQGPLINWVRTANLLYFLFLPLKILGISPDLTIKIFGPIIYGALIVSFYFFCLLFLKFSRPKSLAASLLLVLQLATLRISWDLYRNELGLIFFFFAFANLGKVKKTKNLIFFLVLVGLVALSNELVTVLCLVVLAGYWLNLALEKKWSELLAPSLAIGLSLILFMVVLKSSGQVLYDSHVFFTSEKNYLWRYFYRYDQIMPYSSLVQIITSLFWLLYLFLFPLVLIGIWYLRRSIVLSAATFWLLFGTFSSLIFLGRGVVVWERWLFMLVFPFAIYAVEGLSQIGYFLGKINHWQNKSPKLAWSLAALIWLVIFGCLLIRDIPFLTASYVQAKPPLADEELNNYFPRTMIHNSVGFKEIPDTINVIDWLNEHAPSGSVILVDNRYRGLMITRFNIDNRYIITNPWSEKVNNSTLDAVRQTDFWPIYLIWTATKPVENFDRIYSSGNRGVFQALPEFRNSE